MTPVTYEVIVTALREETARLGQPPSRAYWTGCKRSPSSEVIARFLGVKKWEDVLQMVLPASDLVH